MLDRYSGYMPSELDQLAKSILQILPQFYQFVEVLEEELADVPPHTRHAAIQASLFAALLEAALKQLKCSPRSPIPMDASFRGKTARAVVEELLRQFECILRDVDPGSSYRIVLVRKDKDS